MEQRSTAPAMTLDEVLAGLHDHTNDAIVICEAEPLDAPGPRILFVNRAFTELSGYSAEEVVGRSPRMLQGPGTDREALARMGRALRRWQSVREEVLNYRKDGTPYWVEMSIRPVADEQGWFRFWVSIERDTTERRQKREELGQQLARIDRMARHDRLTGLLNRTGFDEALPAALEECAARGVPLVLFYADLDFFKAINDSMGHAAGDAVLTAVGARIRDQMRTGDIAARIGGDEFVLIRPGGSMDEAPGLADRLIGAISAPVCWGDRLCRFGVSIGIAEAAPGDLTPDALLHDADTALYKSKERGRNRFCIFDPAMAAAARERKHLSEALAEAVQARRLHPWFMPQVRATDRRIEGLEVLARWDDPVRGAVNPEVFLPLATDLRLIDQIDARMLEGVLAIRQGWTATGIPVPRLAFNVSARRLKDPALLDAIDPLGIEPRTIAFELLEAALLDTASREVLWTLDALRERGIGIDIDNFGTGHASIMSLTRVRPDRLKIDRRLIGGIGSDPARRQIVEAMINIAHSMGITVLAEGVETAEKAAILLDLGCDFLQGHLIGAAAPPADCLTYLAPSRSPEREAG